MRSYLFVIVCGGRGLEWPVCLCVCVTGFVCLFLHHIHVVVTVSVFANMMNLSMSVTYCITHCNTLCVYLHTLDRWHWGASALYNCPHSGPVDPLVIRHQLPAPPRIKYTSKYHMMPMVFTLKISKFRPSGPNCHQPQRNHVQVHFKTSHAANYIRMLYCSHWKSMTLICESI